MTTRPRFRPSIVVLTIGVAALAGLPNAAAVPAPPVPPSAAAAPGVPAGSVAPRPAVGSLRFDPVSFRVAGRPAPAAADAAAGEAARVVAAQPPVTTTARPGTAAARAIEFALAQRGLPYVWGGDGPQRGDAGFDCSGLTTAAYAHAGIDLPRTAHTQYYAGPHVPEGAPLEPGDLVFYGVPERVHHVGLYLGEGRMVNAPTFGKPVRLAYVRYTGDDYLGATRPAAGIDAPADGLLTTPDLPVEVPPVPAPGIPPAPEEFAAPEVPAADLPPVDAAADGALAAGPPPTGGPVPDDGAVPAEAPGSTPPPEAALTDTPPAGIPDPGPPAPGSPTPGSPAPGSPAPGSPTPGSPAPGSPAPGSPTPGSPAPGSPTPGSPAPGSPTPGSPAPGSPAPDGTTTAPPASTSPVDPVAPAVAAPPTPAATPGSAQPEPGPPAPEFIAAPARPSSLTLPGGTRVALVGAETGPDGLPRTPSTAGAGGLRWSPADGERTARATVALHPDTDVAALTPGGTVTLLGEDGTSTALTIRSADILDADAAAARANGRGATLRLVLLRTDPATGEVLVVLAE